MGLKDNILNSSSAEKVQNVFLDILEFYTTPSFGSVKQRDFDIFFFGKLKELGAFEKADDIYEVVTKLKITRNKARNLIYENNLRKINTAVLDQQLKEELKKARFLKSNTYLIGIEIENPLLIDHLKAKLKEKGYSTDSSFSPEIVKLSTEALVALIEDYVDTDIQKNIQNKLIEMGYKKDTSFKGFLFAYFKEVARNIAGNTGEMIASEYLVPILDGAVDTFLKIIKGFEK